VSRAKKLVCAEIVNFVHPYTGDTPLHLAVVSPDGKRKQLMELLTRKGSLLNEKNKAFLTPLHLAAELLHYDAMEVLLKQGLLLLLHLHLFTATTTTQLVPYACMCVCWACGYARVCARVCVSWKNSDSLFGFPIL